MSLPKGVEQFPRVTEIISSVVTPVPRLLDWVRDKERSGFDTEAYMMETAERGTAIHNSLQDMVMGKEYETHGIEGKFKKIAEFLEGATEKVCEQPIWDDSFVAYRGTPDLHFIKDGEMYLIDYKTGSPSRTHSVQLHAYRAGLHARTGKLATKLVTFYLGKYAPAEPGSKFPNYLRKDDIFLDSIPIQEGLWDATLLQYAYFN